MAKKKIAIVGAGAVGGYAGAHMVQAGEDVTYIDPWPENVEAIRSEGLRITHIRDVEPFTVKPRALHLTEAQQLAKEAPIDIAFVCMKSYDTAWATTLIKQYLAPGGYVVSLQNCMNEETIAGIVGWGRTVGVVASQISVDLYEPARIRRIADCPRGTENSSRKGGVSCARSHHAMVASRRHRETRVHEVGNAALHPDRAVNVAVLELHGRTRTASRTHRQPVAAGQLARVKVHRGAEIRATIH